MSGNRGNIKTINYYSFVLIIILISGFLLFHHSNCIPSYIKNNPVTAGPLIIQNNATVCPGIKTECFQKIWISNKDNFKLLTFDKTQYLENKMTDQKIILLENAQKKSIKIPNFYLLFHRFPSERDELPFLS
jgi:hypothetical protein